MKLGPLTRGYGFHKNAPGAPAEDKDAGYGFFDDAPGAPAHRPAGPATQAPVPAAAKPEARARPRRCAPPTRAPRLESSTLRVSVDKVDQLINLVGELVITQAMLAQTGQDHRLGAAPAAAAPAWPTCSATRATCRKR